MTCCVCDWPDPLPGPERTIDPWESAEQARHIAAYRELLGRECPPPGLAGDGIVTAGEGKYWPGIVVMAKLLRSTGSTLPLQVWHNAPVGPELDDDPHTTLVDHQAFAKKHPARIHEGFAAKSYALAHCGFRRVLWLDADAYCVADPAPLFAALDAAPLVFWSGNWVYRSTVNEEATGAGAYIDVECQGGMYLIDLAAAWKEMMLARWTDAHADYYWRRKDGRSVNVFHDESSWRMAIQSTRLPFTKLHYWMAGPVMVCPWQGRDYIVHRIRRSVKLYLGTEPRRLNRLPREKEVFEIFESLDPAYAERAAAALAVEIARHTPRARRTAHQFLLGRRHSVPCRASHRSESRALEAESRR